MQDIKGAVERAQALRERLQIDPILLALMTACPKLGEIVSEIDAVALDSLALANVEDARERPMTIAITFNISAPLDPEAIRAEIERCLAVEVLRAFDGGDDPIVHTPIGECAPIAREGTSTTPPPSRRPLDTPPISGASTGSPGGATPIVESRQITIPGSGPIQSGAPEHGSGRAPEESISIESWTLDDQDYDELMWDRSWIDSILPQFKTERAGQMAKRWRTSFRAWVQKHADQASHVRSV